MEGKGGKADQGGKAYKGGKGNKGGKWNKGGKGGGKAPKQPRQGPPGGPAPIQIDNVPQAWQKEQVMELVRAAGCRVYSCKSCGTGRWVIWVDRFAPGCDEAADAAVLSLNGTTPAGCCSPLRVKRQQGQRSDQPRRPYAPQVSAREDKSEVVQELARRCLGADNLWAVDTCLRERLLRGEPVTLLHRSDWPALHDAAGGAPDECTLEMVYREAEASDTVQVLPGGRGLCLKQPWQTLYSMQVTARKTDALDLGALTAMMTEADAFPCCTSAVSPGVVVFHFDSAESAELADEALEQGGVESLPWRPSEGDVSCTAHLPQWRLRGSILCSAAPLPPDVAVRYVVALQQRLVYTATRGRTRPLPGAHLQLPSSGHGGRVVAKAQTFAAASGAADLARLATWRAVPIEVPMQFIFILTKKGFLSQLTQDTGAGRIFIYKDSAPGQPQRTYVVVEDRHGGQALEATAARVLDRLDKVAEEQGGRALAEKLQGLQGAMGEAQRAHQEKLEGALRELRSNVQDADLDLGEDSLLVSEDPELEGALDRMCDAADEAEKAGNDRACFVAIQARKVAELVRQRAQFDTACAEVIERFRGNVDAARPVVQRECRRLGAALPMYAFRDCIIRKVAENDVLVLKAETGSGKSTQVAAYLADHLRLPSGQPPRIVCTQPRKLSALSLADRVLEEWTGGEAHGRGCPIGVKVGGNVRADRSTLVTYATDRRILGESVRDQDLEEYDVLIIDEVHERSIDTDILLGLGCQALMRRRFGQRRGLKVIVMSATLDVDLLVRFFSEHCSGAKVDSQHVPGRTFPVTKCFVPPEEWEADDFPLAAVKLAQRIAVSEDPGDIIVFLTGQDEIDNCVDTMRAWNGREGANVDALPLHGKVDDDDRKRAFSPAQPGRRKVIFATNAAETGVTIDGLRHVIDAGMAKENTFERGVSSLQLVRISKSSAEQRAGRAGRTAPGKCYRLYSEEQFDEFPGMQRAELLRSEPAQAVLKMSAMGVTDITQFPLVDRPSEEDIRMAYLTLRTVGALDQFDHVTEDGKKMVRMELAPHLSQMLLAADKLGCSDDMAVIVAMSSCASTLFFRGSRNDPDSRPKAERAHAALAGDSLDGDLFTWLNVWRKYEGVPERERGKWCKENYLRASKFRAVRSSLRDVQAAMKTNGVRCANSYAEPGPEQRRLLQRAICAGLMLKLAVPRGRRMRDDFEDVQSGSRVMVGRRSCVWLDRQTVPQLFAYMGMVQIGDRLLIEDVTPVRLEWIREALPEGSELLQQIERAIERASAGKHARLPPEGRLSSAVIRTVLGPRGAAIRRLRAAAPRGCEFSFEGDALTVWSMDAEALKQAVDLARAAVDAAVEDVANQVYEHTLAGRTRLVIGAGGKALRVLFRDEAMAVMAHEIPREHGADRQQLRGYFTGVVERRLDLAAARQGCTAQELARILTLEVNDRDERDRHALATNRQEAQREKHRCSALITYAHPEAAHELVCEMDDTHSHLGGQMRVRKRINQPDTEGPGRSMCFKAGMRIVWFYGTPRGPFRIECDNRDHVADVRRAITGSYPYAQCVVPSEVELSFLGHLTPGKKARMEAEDRYKVRMRVIFSSCGAYATGAPDVAGLVDSDGESSVSTQLSPRHGNSPLRGRSPQRGGRQQGSDEAPFRRIRALGVAFDLRDVSTGRVSIRGSKEKVALALAELQRVCGAEMQGLTRAAIETWRANAVGINMGCVIGKGGAGVARIKECTGCAVETTRDRKFIEISGPAAALPGAERMIREALTTCGKPGCCGMIPCPVCSRWTRTGTTTCRACSGTQRVACRGCARAQSASCPQFQPGPTEEFVEGDLPPGSMRRVFGLARVRITGPQGDAVAQAADEMQRAARAGFLERGQMVEGVARVRRFGDATREVWDLEVSGLSQRIDEIDIREACLAAEPPVRPPAVFQEREGDPPRDEDFAMSVVQFGSLFTDQFQVNYINLEPQRDSDKKACRISGQVTVESPEEMLRVLARYPQRVIDGSECGIFGGARMHIVPEPVQDILVPVSAFSIDTLKAKYEHAKLAAEAAHPLVQVRFMEPRRREGTRQVADGASVRVSVRGPRPMDVLLAAGIIRRETRGVALRLDSTDANLIFSPEGRRMMVQLQKDAGAYVQWERVGRTVTVYGSREQVGQVEHHLFGWLSTARERRIWVLGTRRIAMHFARAIECSDGLKVVVRVRENQVEVDGSKEDVEAVDKLSAEFAAGDAAGSEEAEAEDCPICFCGIEDGYTLNVCGHRACKECLRGHVRSCTEPAAKLPVRCCACGDGGECKAELALLDIMELCPSDTKDQLYKKALLDLTQGKVVKCCQTPNCPQVYRPGGTRDGTWMCDLCGWAVCTLCKADPHPGMSCEQAKARAAAERRLNDAAERKRVDAQAFNDLKKADIDCQVCPGCDTIVIKESGCNKMACSCGMVFCWLCRKDIRREGYGHFGQSAGQCILFHYPE